MITINCKKDDNTETITAHIDILKKSNLFENMYNDTHESTNWDLTNDKLVPIYLKNVINLMENQGVEINSDIQHIKNFIEFLTCADLLLLDDNMHENIHRLIDDQVKLLNSENLLTIILYLNDAVKCEYIDRFGGLLLKTHIDDLIKFVKDNKLHDYTTIYINDIMLTQNVVDLILKSYIECCFDKLSKKLVNQNVNMIHKTIEECVYKRRGIENELKIVY